MRTFFALNGDARATRARIVDGCSMKVAVTAEKIAALSTLLESHAERAEDEATAGMLGRVGAILDELSSELRGISLDLDVMMASARERLAPLVAQSVCSVPMVSVAVQGASWRGMPRVVASGLAEGRLSPG